MRHTSKQFETCVVLSLRHLGDAVIVSGFINAFLDQFPGATVDVLGREESRVITRELCTVRNYIPIDIPVFGHHRKDICSAFSALRTIARLRRRKYDCCINLMGDFRENMIARLLGARKVMAPLWDSDHPFRRHIRTISLPDRGANRPGLHLESPAYYSAIDSFAAQIGIGELHWPKWSRSREKQASAPVVGIHPGASHVSKQWPMEKWRALIQRLATRHYAIRLYGAPSEEANLRVELQGDIKEFGIELVTSGISGFLQSLRTLDVLICVDSFSCHAAHAVGTPAVILFGPFDPAVMTPPTGTALSAGKQCAMFPCYNGRSCRNTQRPFVCVRDIAVHEVMREVEAVISRSDLWQDLKQARDAS